MFVETVQYEVDIRRTCYNISIVFSFRSHFTPKNTKAYFIIQLKLHLLKSLLFLNMRTVLKISSGRFVQQTININCCMQKFKHFVHHQKKVKFA